MKEAPNQKVQEKKPLLKFKNTKKNMCRERVWNKCFPHRPHASAHATSLTKEPCLAFEAVEQPSIFKPCKKFTASPHSLAT